MATRSQKQINRSNKAIELVNAIEHRIRVEGYEIERDAAGELWDDVRRRIQKEGHRVFVLKAEVLWLERILKKGMVKA